MIKLETKSEHVEAELTRLDGTSATMRYHANNKNNNMAELSIALVSPGLSKSILNDHKMREKIRLSLTLKNKQQDIIQKRLLKDVQANCPRRQRRTPARLNFGGLERTMSLQTAPLQGAFSDVVANHRERHLKPECGPKSCEIAGYRSPCLEPPHLPAPYLGRLTPPYTAIKLPPLRDTPIGPTHPLIVQPQLTKTYSGLDTLTKAARLQIMREEYLRACARSFDCLHGLD